MMGNVVLIIRSDQALLVQYFQQKLTLQFRLSVRDEINSSCLCFFFMYKSDSFIVVVIVFISASAADEK